MIWGKLIWGAFLAGLLGYAFRRARKWEHGAEADVMFANKYGKETYILILPTALFWILLVILSVFLFRFGTQDGIVRFEALLADVLLLLSVYFLLLLLMLPFLRERFSARACAVLWLMPAFLLWQANALFTILPLPRRTVYLPRRLLPVIGAVWLAGFLAVGGYYLISHLIFRASVRRHSAEETEEEVCGIWQKEREAMDYRYPVSLLRGDVSAPLSMGRTKRSLCTVLPKRDYTQAELSMIFRHELHHLQRCDVDTKVFLCLCNALCWFNPLVWIATRKAAEDLERSCDEIVTEEMGEAERRAYANLLLDSVSPVRGCTTCLSAAAGTLRYRLKSIMEQRKRTPGTILLMAALFCCTMCFGTVSVSDSRGSFTSLLLTPDTEIMKIYIGSSYADVKWDDAALREALEEIELEHVAGLRTQVLDGEQIAFLLSGGRFAYLTERALFLRHGRAVDSYLLKTPVDWGKLRSCFLE